MDHKVTRIFSLDLIRGFALLGILGMNVQSFSMPSLAYVRPEVWGDWRGWNYLAWAFCHSFFDLKFISLFSLLFGAGIFISLENQKSVKKFFQRLSILLVFGVLSHV